MSVAIITGSAGLVGSETVGYFSAKGMDVVGIDNGMRKEFFGEEASTAWVRENLKKTVKNYMTILMQKLNARNRLEVVIAAQALAEHEQYNSARVEHWQPRQLS